MPRAPLKPCGQPGCGRLVTSGKCDVHRRESVRQYEAQPERRAVKSLYATKRWQDLRVLVLRTNPLCVECRKVDRLTAAEHVDHIKPHCGDESLFFDFDNLQGLCKPCHSRKTAKEDGGFGNRRKVGV
ncbi:HNH endonuclease [Chitinibacter fontanus]|uniref:Putative HNH nuclease YajD n=1 Tax=Chitinibacter fontanus TaxID=1737446 RepID=A0A7D5Z9F4_9NEIS|nr:HNH endonuclease signature motif containing protein [Chitinibacter fontanus]QLI80805.1 HNH endonuclease [Chitinibacter fontanus]